MTGTISIRAATVVVVAILIVGAMAVPARGHALLDRAEPATGSVVPEDRAPRRVALQFTEPVSIVPGAIVVLDASLRRVGPLEPRLTARSRVEVDLPVLAAGAYAVRWRVTSADSHVVRGTSWFVIGFAAAPPPLLRATGAPALPWLETSARWLALVAVLGLVGAVVFGLTLRRGSGSSPLTAASVSPRVPLVLGLLLLGAEVMRALAQSVAVAEAPLPAALDRTTLVEVLGGSRFAVWWWLRLAAGLALATRLARRPSGRHGAATLALATVLLVGTAAAGHAVSGRLPIAVSLVADVVHLAAAALWLGGLAYVGFALGSERERRGDALTAIVPALSTAALGSVLVLVVTGVVSATAQVGGVAWLTRSAYGQALLVKLGLVASWLAVAAVNRFLLRPRLASTGALLTSLVRVEAIVGLAVLLVVAVLGSLPPPGARALPSATEVARQAGPLRVALTVDPVWVGVSRFRVALADSAGRPPDDVARVVLTFTMDGMNMGRTHVTLAPQGAGAWETDGFYVGMPGVSQIGVAIARRDGADLNTVFRIEIPDIAASELAGLRPVTGMSAFALFGILTAVCSVLAVVAATAGTRRVLLPVAAGVLAVVAAGWAIAERRPGASAMAAERRARGGPESVARGRDVYTRQCVTCHGATGNGDGPAAASLLPPPSDLTVHARWHGDDQLFWFVTHGVAGTPMIGFGDRLTARERWDAIAYVQTLASAPTATALRPSSRPPAIDVSPAPSRAAAVAPATPPSIASSEPAPSARPSSGTPPSASSGSAATAPAARTAPVGRLVYGPDFDNNLWLMTLPDGKTTQLTHFGPLEFAGHPVWSPDGGRIAFSFYRLPGGDAIPVPDGTDLYVMRATGTDVRVLASHDARGVALQHPAWSADGRSVYANATAAGGAPAVDRIDASTGSRVRVVAGADFPTLSRDGRRLAYVRIAPPPARGQSLWWSQPDGTGAREVVGTQRFDKLFSPRFAPDGKRLLFAAVGQPVSGSSLRFDPLRVLTDIARTRPAFANGDVWELWTVDLEGGRLTAVTSLGEDLPVGTWSPDGRYMAFLGGGSVRTAEAGITVLDASGALWRRLTTQPGHRGLDWTRP